MKTRVVAQDEDHLPYITDLLNTLLSMQKTSSYTDCTLVSSDGTPVPAHLPMLSLSWPRLEQLLPPSDGLCNCQCCVPGIALSGEAETVQAVLELAYTGRTGLLGVEREGKVRQLLQVLGLEWQLERVLNETECNNNKFGEKVPKLTECLIFPVNDKSDSPTKECVKDVLLISPVDVNERRKSIPREVKAKKLVSLTKSPGMMVKNEERKTEQLRQLRDKTAVKVCSTRPLRLPEKNKSVKDVLPYGPPLGLDDSIEVVNSLPELRRSASKEKGLSLNSVKVTESVPGVQKTMIAPGTLMTNVDNCVRYFCSYCDIEMTKYTKTEKEIHWAVAHFSEELSKLTQYGRECNVHDCNMKVETGEMVKHVGVFHKKIYNFLSVLPSRVPDKEKQSPVQKPSELLNPSRKFYSRVVPIKPGNQLKVPVVFVQCTLLNSQPGIQLSAPNHLTEAVIEEGTVLSESISSKYPVTNERWYYTCSSSNNNLNLPVLTSLVSHYSSLLGEEDPAKCSFCPHLKEQHSRLSLHQSVDKLASGEGKYWCGVCCQQVSSKEQFHHHLATHLLTCMDKPGPGLGSGLGSNGRKDIHVFLNDMSNRYPEIKTSHDSPETIDTGGNIKEEIASDSTVGHKCNICEKVMKYASSLKRHMQVVHSKGNLKMTSAVNLDDSGFVVAGPVLNKDFDFCDDVLNKVNNDLLGTFGEGFAMNDKKSDSPAEDKSEVVKINSREKESGTKKPTCPICNKIISNISRVKSHLALRHFKEKIMQEMSSDLHCALCDRTFPRNSDLVIHVGCQHKRNEAYLKEYFDLKEEIDMNEEEMSEPVYKIDRKSKDEQLSESDVLTAFFKDEINLNSSAGLVESEDILSFFAQP